MRADPDSIRELPPLVGVMRAGRKAKAERVPVRLAAKVTEVGTVELWCQSRTDDRRWRLQIQLRGPGGTPPPRMAVTGAESDAVVIEQSEVDAASEAIRSAFAAPAGAEEGGPGRLIKRLEEILDAPREGWPPSALRAFWEPIRDSSEMRNKGPRHESRWFNLAGYCLRPGTGFPLDENRIKALWPAFHQGVKHTKDIQCWADWWVLWRRVAAGLNRAHHEEIHRRVTPFLLPAKGAAAAKKLSRPKPEAHELAEIWRCAASLERLAANLKEPLGDALIKELARPGLPNHVLWCLGRLGSRTPIYGPANTVVPPEKASRWARVLLERPIAPGRESADAIFALVQIGRVSGDRARDLDDALRAEILSRLAALGADDEARRPVREFQELEAAQQGQALGDALPAGLRLVVRE